MTPFADAKKQSYRMVGHQMCQFVQYVHWMTTCFPPQPAKYAYNYEKDALAAGLQQGLFEGTAVEAPAGCSAFGANKGAICLTYGDGTAYWRDLLTTTNA